MLKKQQNISLFPYLSSLNVNVSPTECFHHWYSFQLISTHFTTSLEIPSALLYSNLVVFIACQALGFDDGLKRSFIDAFRPIILDNVCILYIIMIVVVWYNITFSWNFSLYLLFVIWYKVSDKSWFQLLSFHFFNSYSFFIQEMVSNKKKQVWKL